VRRALLPVRGFSALRLEYSAPPFQRRLVEGHVKRGETHIRPLLAAAGRAAAAKGSSRPGQTALQAVPRTEAAPSAAGRARRAVRGRG
jgi:hypothetical protein